MPHPPSLQLVTSRVQVGVRIDEYLQCPTLPLKSAIEADLVASSMPLPLMNKGLPPSSHSLHIRSYLNLCS